MQKERIRISLDVSKALGEQLRLQADLEDKTVNALIREILQDYLTTQEKKCTILTI